MHFSHLSRLGDRNVTRPILLAAALGLPLALPALAAGQTVDFEPPTYTAGQTIVGQDGWTQNSYDGFLNTDPGSEQNAVVVSTDPLEGTQSVFVNGTTGTGRIDVTRGGFGTYTDDGTTAPDLNVKWLMQTDGGGSTFFPGLVVSNDGINGSSPVFLRVNGSTLQHFDGSWQSIGTVPSGLLEFSVDLDLKVDGAIDIGVRNVTAGETTFTQMGSGLTQFEGNSTLGDTGLWVILSSGQGTATFDDIRFTPIPEPTALAGLLAAGFIGASRRRRLAR